MFVQKPGRARPNVANPRAIFYISAARAAKASKVLAQSDAENAVEAKKDATVAMDRPVAEIITAHCKPLVQDELYDNPASDPVCPCKTCLAFPPATRPAHCRCSGCLPEVSDELYAPLPKEKKAPNEIPQSQRLTKPMKAAGIIQLQEFRLSIWFEGSDLTQGLTPLEEFLPDVIMQELMDRFSLVKTVADVTRFVKNLSGMAGHHEELYALLVELKPMFAQMKKDKAAEKAAEKLGEQAVASSSSLPSGPNESPNTSSIATIDPRVA
ncbi:hypothetical protein B0H16DRAFT_1529733 [Mycena metata]|uniref:Uncharacterized protein n=1 Tax=Mycena metata TaxID=1033252 RepID=A0AAD7JCP8_9AGAR|nr:hypothetical protein B0H16DRAFT_1529733 [Mycena metata]